MNNSCRLIIILIFNTPPSNFYSTFRGREVYTNLYNWSVIVAVRVCIALFVNLVDSFLCTFVHLEFYYEYLLQSEKYTIQTIFCGVILRLRIKAEPAEKNVNDRLKMLLVLIVQYIWNLQEKFLEQLFFNSLLLNDNKTLSGLNMSVFFLEKW